MDSDLYQRIGKRIRDAREALGLTQEALARAVTHVSGEPMTSTKVSYFETGARRIQLEDLEFFATALGKPVEYFLSTTPRSQDSADNFRAVMFRATSPLNPNAQKHVADLVDVILNTPVQLGDSLPLIPRKTPEEILALLRRTRPPVYPTTIAHASGVRVEFRTLEHSMSGFLVLTEGHKVIVVNNAQPDTIQDYVIAHELGHLWLGHYPETHGMNINLAQPFESPVADPMKERQADRFAHELLMPESWIREDWKKCNGDLGQMASLYRVTPQSMWVRLIEIDLVKPSRFH